MGRLNVAGDLSPPEPIRSWHQVEFFSCGESVLDSWLLTRALKNEHNGASRTYVLARQKRVVGYYALAVGSVTHALVPGNMRRNMPDPIPVMLLARLAVDMSLQGKGIGKALVRDAVLRTCQAARIAGIRALLVHALNQQAASFYGTCGFLPSPLENLVLMLTLDSIKASLPS
jgi:GNAT superfamily N-acetyltransferase